MTFDNLRNYGGTLLGAASASVSSVGSYLARRRDDALADPLGAVAKAAAFLAPLAQTSPVTPIAPEVVADQARARAAAREADAAQVASLPARVASLRPDSPPPRAGLIAGIVFGLAALVWLNRKSK